jgi:hypothetical protein
MKINIIIYIKTPTALKFSVYLKTIVKGYLTRPSSGLLKQLDPFSPFSRLRLCSLSCENDNGNKKITM